MIVLYVYPCSFCVGHNIFAGSAGSGMLSSHFRRSTYLRYFSHANQENLISMRKYYFMRDLCHFSAMEIHVLCRTQHFHEILLQEGSTILCAICIIFSALYIQSVCRTQHFHDGQRRQRKVVLAAPHYLVSSEEKHPGDGVHWRGGLPYWCVATFLFECDFCKSQVHILAHFHIGMIFKVCGQ